jgi:chemotaxis signal transduction protein
MKPKKNIDIVFFHIHGSYCAMELTSIKEIVRPYSIHPIPNGLETIVGLINVRGIVIPVSDPFFIFSEISVDESGRVRKHILIFDNPENPMGMIVDSVDKIQSVNANDLETLDKFNIKNIENKYITNVIRQLNKQLELETVYLLNLEILLDDVYKQVNKNIKTYINLNGGSND